MKKSGIIVSLFITLLSMLLFMFFYKVVPLGNKLLGNGDYSLYYVLWDYVHHIRVYNIFDSFNFLLVNNMISIPNLLICLFPRRLIPNIVSILCIIKVLLINGTMYYSLNKIFKDKNIFYKVLFSLIYTFSGFIFIHYININYLDILYLFPLLMLGYYKLIKDNRILLFNIIFILCGIVNFRMFFVVLLFLVGLILFSFCILEFNNKKSKLIKLLISIVLGLGILSVIMYINIDYIISSNELFAGCNMFVDNVYLNFRKLCYIFPSVIAIVYFIKLLFRKDIDKRNKLFFIIIILYLGLCMFIDSVCKLWHLNNYYFSMGFISFILVYMLCIGGMYGIKDFNDKLNILSLIVSIIFIIGYVIVWYYYLKDINLLNIDSYLDMIKYFIVLIIFILGVVLICKYNNLLFNILLGISYVIFIIINCKMYINVYSDNSLIELSNKINTLDSYYRYSDYTGKLDSNFGLLNNVNTVQGNSLISNTDKLLMLDSFGYVVYGNESSSCCGNLIINSILLNKYFYVYGDFNNQLYDLVWEDSDVSNSGVSLKLYESKYNLGYVIPYSGNSYDLDSGDVIYNTNMLYKTLFDKDEDIVKVVDYEKKKDNYVYNLSNDSVYYLVFNSYNELNKMIDDDIKLEVIYEKNNVYYASFYVLEDKVINIDISLELYSLSIDEYLEFIDEHYLDLELDNGKIKYEALEDQSLLIPIDYSDNLVIKVNDKEVSYKKNVFDMVSIDVFEGSNEIEITYRDKNVMIYIVISIVSLLLNIIFMVIFKKIM